VVVSIEIGSGFSIPFFASRWMLKSGTGGAPDNLCRFIHLKSAEPVKDITEFCTLLIVEATWTVAIVYNSVLGMSRGRRPAEGSGC
jgi:hypothetical protein